jgi:hypothetical protein
VGAKADGSGWTNCNFEVEDLHTHVGGGICAHTNSDFGNGKLAPENPKWTDFSAKRIKDLSLLRVINASLQVISAFNLVCVIALILLILVEPRISERNVQRLILSHIALYSFIYLMSVFALTLFDYIHGLDINSFESLLLTFQRLIFVFPALPVYTLYIILYSLRYMHRYIRLTILLVAAPLHLLVAVFFISQALWY